jgi:hypothetical protein
LTKLRTADGKPAAKATRILIAGRAGIAIGRGARAIMLINRKGAVLELSGHQTGLMANADLSGAGDHAEVGGSQTSS